MRRWILHLLLICVFIPVQRAAGQADPAAPDYYRTWIAAQLSVWETVTRVEFRERTVRTLDSPFGITTAEVVARVTGLPDERDYERALTSAAVNGRRVPPRRLAEFQDRWERFSRQLGRIADAFSGWRLRALQAARPSSTPVVERYGGQSAYRVDLIPDQALAGVDRITLWFASTDGRLLASRTIVDPRGQRSALTVAIDYERHEGLDVPVVRRVEGTVQSRRRLRHYTTIVTLESRLDELRFTFR